MAKIFNPLQSAAILAAIASVLGSNNGYAEIGSDPLIADAVAAAGFVVIASKDLFGLPVFKAFSKASQAALAADAAAGGAFAVSNYKPISLAPEGPDYEGLILARQERAGLYD